MDRIIKINSEQSGYKIDGSTNLVDFIIPAGQGVLDMSKTYVGIVLKARSTNAGGVKAVHNLVLRYELEAAHPTAVYPNVALVKNASMISQNLGTIEEVRNCGILRTNLEVYKGSSGKFHNTLGKGQGLNYSLQFGEQPCADLNTLGTEDSRYRNHDLRIPLSDIFNVGDQLLDTNKTGQVRVHLQIQLDKLSVIPREGGANDNNVLWNNRRQDDDTNLPLINQGPTGATGSTDNTSFDTQCAYEDENRNPFWVGMPVKVNGKVGANQGGAGAIAERNLVITRIDRNANDTLKLHFNDVIRVGGIPGGQALFDLTVESDVTVASRNIDILRVELNAHMNASPQAPNQMVYTVFKDQHDNFPVANTLNRYYQLEPATKNVLITFNSLGHRSADPQLKSYRLTIDGNEVTPKEVTWGGPIHHDLVMKTFLNMGMTPENMNEQQHSYDDGITLNRAGFGGDHLARMILCPIPLKNGMTRLGVELIANDGQTLLGDIHIFSEVAKVL